MSSGRGGKMAEQLRPHTVLAKDFSSVPNTCKLAHIFVYHQLQWGQCCLLFLGSWGAYIVHRHSGDKAHTRVWNKNIFGRNQYLRAMLLITEIFWNDKKSIILRANK